MIDRFRLARVIAVLSDRSKEVPGWVQMVGPDAESMADALIEVYEANPTDEEVQFMEAFDYAPLIKRLEMRHARSMN